MAVAAAALALFFDVGHFATRSYFAVAADHTSARECREAEKSDEAHEPIIDAFETRDVPFAKTFRASA
jgi:hypothetical protein